MQTIVKWWLEGDKSPRVAKLDWRSVDAFIHGIASNPKLIKVELVKGPIGQNQIAEK